MGLFSFIKDAGAKIFGSGPAKADTLPWIAQKGRISTPSVTVEGKSFDLSCGCKMRPAK